MFRQVVRDLQLLEALDQVPAQCPQLDAADILLVLVVCGEFEADL